MFELAEDDTLIELPPSEKPPDASADVEDFKYLIGTKHRDDDTLESHVTVEVLAEEFDPEDGPLTVAYRRQLKPNGKYFPLNEDDKYPI